MKISEFNFDVYKDSYRKYVRDCLNDPNFAVEHLEDFDDWLKSEQSWQESQFIKNK